MANRKRTSRGGRAGGFKGFLVSAGMIVMLAAAVFGWWSYNGFQSIGDAVDWFQSKSATMDQCVDGELAQGASDVENLINAHGCVLPNVVGSSTEGGNVSLSADAKETLLNKLSDVSVMAAASVSYSRSEWKHWLDLDGDGCDTREQVLKASGIDVKTDPKTCKVLSGTWVEPYSGKTYTDPSAMDLDHVVPLSWAAANGGNSWPAEKKTAFANDPLNLFLSDASENRSKGDKGPSEYLPPNQSFQCTYVTSFVSVVISYDLTMSQLDKAAAEKVIEERC